MSDELNLGTADPAYWERNYKGVFEPMRETNRTDWLAKHPELAKFLPRAKSMADPNPTSPRKKRQPKPLPLRAPELAGDVLVLWLPLPPAKLQANKANNKSWQETHRLRKAHRSACALVASLARLPEPFRRARLDITTWTANKVDPANIWHWCKAAIDALQGLVIEDDRELETGDARSIYGKATDGRREMQFTVTRLS